jgi:hypothetical protein
VPAKYRQVTIEQYLKLVLDRALREETRDILAYTSDPRYDSGDKTLLKADNIKKVRSLLLRGTYH